MISSKELKYVGNFAIQIPMPGEEYSKQVMERIKKCVELYEKKLKRKEYTIMFSNNEEISLEIQEIGLCHMLGIDYKAIKSDLYKKYRKQVLNMNTTNFDSYDVLNAILENSDKVVELDNDKQNEYKILNYYKSQIKTEIFEKIDLERINFGAININESEKTIYFESNEPLCPYFTIGIIAPELKTDIPQRYIIRTLQAPTKIKEMFEDKETTIPTQVLTSDENSLKRIIASPEEKIRLLKMYKNIIKTYNIPYKLNTNGDYETILNILNSYNNGKQKTL